MKVWKEVGYAAFADGVFGNGGQNLYVSQKGVLQRIFHFDFNQNGYTDVLFVNSQDMGERVPAYVYRDILGERHMTKLPTNGAYAAAMADLNNDGHDDIVIAHQHNGTHADLTAFVYYGSPNGFTEHYKIELPAPNCRAVAIGDFNGDGLKDIAFASNSKLRIFYQTPTGFSPGNFTEYELEVTHLSAADIDNDGTDELYVRVRKDLPRILWGSPTGINLNETTIVGHQDESARIFPSSTPGWDLFAEGWTPKILKLNGQVHLFRPENEKVHLIPYKARIAEKPIVINCNNAISVATGDLNHDGVDDIVIAVCDDRNKVAQSTIFWADKKGFTGKTTSLATVSARDVLIGDLDNSGHNSIVVCQGRTDIMNTTESLIFVANSEGINTEPLRLTTHDATTVLLGHTSDHNKPELIFINHVDGRFRGDISAYLYYNGPKGFSPENRAELPGWSAPAAMGCDFSDDGWADILLCNCAENAPEIDPGSFLYWGSADGYNAQSKLILPTIRAHGCAVGDFRHSGYLDIAIGGFRNPELLIFRGNKNGFDIENPQRIIMDPNAIDFIRSKDQSIFDAYTFKHTEVRWMLAADFNNDGWLDIFVSLINGARSFILWGGPNGFSMDRVTWLEVEGASCARAADLTGNGWLDLIIGGHQAMSKSHRWESYVYIYWGGPNGYSEDRRMQLPANTCNSLAIADLNNDGVLDIFATSYNAGRSRDCDSFIYWGKPGGIYSATNRSRLFTHSACGCLAADLNDDGWIDIAVANHKTHGNHVGYSQIWLNGPNGFSEKNVTELPSIGPHGMLGVDLGNIMTRGQEEYYESSPYQLPPESDVISIRWKAKLPPKCWVRAQMRFANSRQELEAIDWVGPAGPSSWFENEQTLAKKYPGRWIQYKLALGSKSGATPRVVEVEVEYT